jgi:hypothetical protein
MTEVDTFDLASLEAFTSDLVVAGFEPEPDTARRIWRGPIHPSFAPLTPATQMRVYVRDGWPFVSPVLFVDGINTNHLTEWGFVCLWHTGDGSGAWITVDGFFTRIDEWCTEAANGWNTRGLAQDAWLNFTNKHSTVATFDLDELGIGDPGGWGSFHAEVTFPWHIELKPGSKRAADELEGLWFQAGPREVPCSAASWFPRRLSWSLPVTSWRCPRRRCSQGSSWRRRSFEANRRGQSTAKPPAPGSGASDVSPPTGSYGTEESARPSSCLSPVGLKATSARCSTA